MNLYGIKKNKDQICNTAGREISRRLGPSRFDHWSFVLRTIKSWLDPSNPTSWRSLEAKFIHPCRLQDLIYTDIPIKQVRTLFGPIIENALVTWRLVTEYTNTNNKWHFHTPIFYNHNLLIGGRPAAYPIWSNNGIHILGQLFNCNGLRTFEDLKEQYNLCRFSRFLYFQLHAAMKTYGVPWNSELPKHDLAKQLYNTTNTRGTVSALYAYILQASYKPMATQIFWQKMYALINSEISWESVWNNTTRASKNPNYQTIHLKIVHRAYFTPKRRHAMKLESSPCCQLCTQGCLGTFTHMFWECPGVQLFWLQVTKSLSKILNKEVPCCPVLCLLNDNSQFPMSTHEKRFFFF